MTRRRPEARLGKDIVTPNDRSMLGAEPGSSQGTPVGGAATREPAGAPHNAAVERRALGWCALAAVGVIAWIVQPVAVGIFVGMLLGFAVQPLYERLRRHARPDVAAFLTVIAATVAIVALVGGFGYLLVTKGAMLAKQLLGALGPGGGASEVVARITDRARSLGFSAQVLESKLRDGAAGAAAGAANVAELIASATASAALALFFAMLTMHYILRNWPKLASRAQIVLPLRADYTRALFDELRRVGRTTMLGTIGTGLAQGVFATIGYAVAGVPEPVFFGTATAVASLIPAVGTLLIWVPIGASLVLSGHAVRGVLELAWGAVAIVGLSDYVIRPRLVAGEGETPALVTFAALFGGVEAFGLKGLVLGPVLMLLAIAVLHIYAKEAASGRAHAPHGRAPAHGDAAPGAPPDTPPGARPPAADG
jgi:predicted PurR-regulated permease PerM